MSKLIIFIVFGLVLAGCNTPQAVVEEQYNPDGSVQDYISSLERLNLIQTSLGERWVRWANPEENLPMISILPFSEIRHFDPEIPEAAYFLFEAVRGHRIEVKMEGDPGLSYFADLFGLDDSYDPRNMPEEVTLLPVASAHFVDTAEDVRQGESTIIFEPRNTRFYLVRIIPRLLEGGRLKLSIENQALAGVWPVENTTVRQVWSHFGDPRDGGARVHHGIDIFAPRGTPILAPVAGRITRVGERERGGLSVSMMDDERRLSFYFAHLHEYGDIEAGQMVEAGHVLGTVGNTGNAITTPPHLHLGIYDRGWGGAVDPWYFLVPVPYSGFLTPREIVDRWEDFQPNLTLGTRFGYPFGDNQSLELVFFTQIPGNNPVSLSAARRDGSGRVLDQSERPIMKVDWSEPYDSLYQGVGFNHEGDRIRLIALRSGALGFRFPDGSLRWISTVPSNMNGLETLILDLEIKEAG